MSDDKDCVINMTNHTTIASTSINYMTITLNGLDQRISDHSVRTSCSHYPGSEN